jgi:hypothetical protein
MLTSRDPVGAYTAIFPNRFVLGYLYPAVGFALSHTWFILIRQQVPMHCTFALPKERELCEGGMSMAKNRWSELSAGQRRGVMLSAVVQVTLLIAALVDIWRRPEEEIRGSKRLWTAAAFVNFIGPSRISASAGGDEVECRESGFATSRTEALWRTSGTSPVRTS